MGRSMATVQNPAMLELAREKLQIRNDKLDRTFEVFARDGKLYQSEFKADGEKILFETTYPLDFVVGSGQHGFTFITRRDHHLFQTPLSWYSRTGTWDLSPGYEHADYGFNRPIQAGCIVCHSGRPRVVSDGSGLFRDPPFQELPIGCENCHGPGGSHVKQPTRKSIVNPARLPARLAENICMNCHQGGDARVLQPGKNFADFHPGTWLGDTLAIFKIRKADTDRDLLEHHAAMAASRCFTASAGKLSCMTCHDPHANIQPEKAVAYYRERCLTCHTDQSCRLPLKAREPRNDCAGCHMPKRDAAVISHTALTNHRIVRRLGVNSAKPSIEPELDWVNPPPGRSTAPPPTLLRAYGELMDKQPEFRSRYFSLLDELARTMPDNGFVHGALGRKLLYDVPSDSANAEALEHLEKAAKLGAGTAVVEQDIAEALARLNRLDESVEHLKAALQMEFYNPLLHKTLAMRLIKQKKYPQALEEMRRYVELFPEDDFMRGLLQKASAAR
jgi:Doubled CXXCH motif (Paired_CXXCH_1)